MQYAVSEWKVRLVLLVPKPCLDNSNGQRESYWEISFLSDRNKAYIEHNIIGFNANRVFKSQSKMYTIPNSKYILL